MTSALNLIVTVLLGLSIMPASYDRAAAKPLSSETCVKLVNEHTELASSGIETSMDAEPQGSGTTLNAEELARIERFLFIEGQIRFRCPEVKLPGLGTPEPSGAQAAQFEKRQAAEVEKRRAAKREKKKAAKLRKKQNKKQKAPLVPLPERKPKTPS